MTIPQGVCAGLWAELILHEAPARGRRTAEGNCGVGLGQEPTSRFIHQDRAANRYGCSPGRLGFHASPSVSLEPPSPSFLDIGSAVGGSFGADVRRSGHSDGLRGQD